MALLLPMAGTPMAPSAIDGYGVCYALVLRDFGVCVHGVQQSGR